MTEKFVIGLVGAPFGVKGFVKVRSCSGEIDHLLKLKSVIVSMDGNERLLQIRESSASAAGANAALAANGALVAHTALAVHSQPSVLMRFAGIDTPEAVKSLSGAQLLASREQAAPLGEGEFYIEDLKGLPVMSENSETIGHITDIIEGGGGELAEVKLNNGEKHMVPFNSEFFPEITLDKVMLRHLWILD